MLKRLILVAGLVLGVVGAAWGDTSTKYTYAEKGYTGKMELINFGRYFRIKIDTTMKANGQQCSVEANESGPRINDEYPAIAASEDGAKFNLKFSKDGKTVVIDVEDKGNECGMAGWFGGKYIKAGK